ncbi:MAG: hypothetical protein LBQ54_13335 [Planctomycetaceae bacterium]|jgi:hypothetical protein|nr:hypothetical protein [Planctomycetaceae bacterium]
MSRLSFLHWRIFLTLIPVLQCTGAVDCFFFAAVSGSEYPQTVYYVPLDLERLQQEEPVFRGQSPLPRRVASNPPLRGSSQKEKEEKIESYLFKTPDEPAGSINTSLQKDLNAILDASRKEAAVSQTDDSTSVTPFPQPANPSAVTAPADSSASPNPGTGNPSGNALVAVEMVPGKNANSFFATLKNGEIIAVTQYDNEYYDLNGRKVLYQDNGKVASKGTSPDNSLFLIILASASLLAALYVGFLAVDYKRRLEQTLMNQNQRFLTPGETLSSEISSLEPDTLSFSTGIGSSGLDSLDTLDVKTSFRTIA